MESEGIAAATGTAVTGTKRLSKMIESYMVEAVKAAGEQGITDPDKIRQMQLAARDKAVADYEAERAKAAAAP